MPLHYNMLPFFSAQQGQAPMTPTAPRPQEQLDLSFLDQIGITPGMPTDQFTPNLGEQPHYWQSALDTANTGGLIPAERQNEMETTGHLTQEQLMALEPGMKAIYPDQYSREYPKEYGYEGGRDMRPLPVTGEFSAQDTIGIGTEEREPYQTTVDYRGITHPEEPRKRNQWGQGPVIDGIEPFQEEPYGELPPGKDIPNDFSSQMDSLTRTEYEKKEGEEKKDKPWTLDKEKFDEMMAAAMPMAKTATRFPATASQIMAKQKPVDISKDVEQAYLLPGKVRRENEATRYKKLLDTQKAAFKERELIEKYKEAKKDRANKLEIALKKPSKYAPETMLAMFNYDIKKLDKKHKNKVFELEAGSWLKRIENLEEYTSKEDLETVKSMLKQNEPETEAAKLKTKKLQLEVDKLERSKKDYEREEARLAKLPQFDRLVANQNPTEKNNIMKIIMARKAVMDMRTALENRSSRFSFLEDSDFTFARNRWVEGIGRLQSGGAIQDDEIRSFKNLAPRVTEKDPRIWALKLSTMEQEMDNRLRMYGLTPDVVSEAGVFDVKVRPLKIKSKKQVQREKKARKRPTPKRPTPKRTALKPTSEMSIEELKKELGEI